MTSKLDADRALEIAEQIISGYIRVGAIDMVNVNLERVMMEIRSALAANQKGGG